MLGNRNDDCLSEHSYLFPALLLFTLFILIASLSQTSYAVRITFQQGVDGYTGTADNSIYSELVSNSNGGGQSIIVGRNSSINSGNRRRGLISFDITSLPLGIFIIDATLELNVSFGKGGAKTMTVHRLLKDWGEGNVDAAGSGSDVEGTGAPGANGDATWSSNHLRVSTWTSPGGDFEPVQSGAGISPDIGAFLIRGAGMITDLQAWADGTQPNNGWILIGDENDLGTAKRIRSSENSFASGRPRLIIDYSNQPAETPTPTPTETPPETPTPTFTETPLILETPTPTITPTPAPTRSADLNNDGTIDEKDLLLFYGQWHQVVQ